ncbi:hypothetical protein DSO57_1025066 [Entomophthora muscae]|uniref:Uncharacterized protein n=1 Tax=Entomophthora muscae TaxID=34485 RepID=A0ACC2SFR3_9FUNG|nr:hypothetical protein DSO57_1025066 [Entomophthora muscae]
MGIVNTKDHPTLPPLPGETKNVSMAFPLPFGTTIEHYWDLPTEIAYPVYCPLNTACDINPIKPIKKKGIYSKPPTLQMVNFIINHLTYFFPIHPVYIYYGNLSTVSFIFNGPANKTLTAKVLNIKITGEHEEYYAHGLHGEEYFDTRFYVFPLVLENLVLDAAIALVDI